MRITALSVLAFACSSEPQAEQTLEPNPSEVHPHEGEFGGHATTVVHEVPIAAIEVGADTYEFFAWEDGSAGLLQAGNGQLSPALDRWVEEATVAEVFWALSEPGTQIPDLLVHHHERMAADRGTSPDPRTQPQGWLAVEVGQGLPEGAPAIPSQCTNATFNSNICGSASYPDGPGCFNNITSSIDWSTAGTSRYRAGLCVQSGSANDTLSYSHYTNDACTEGCRVLHTVWGYFFNTYPSPHSNIYLSWWWIAPSDAARRSWDHTGSNAGNAVYDWGTKQLATTDCSY